MALTALMLQGTGSDVGKSVLVAGLCRALIRRGFNVRPFKPQNMSNNAAVTADGGEIGRAQALQARACGVELHTDMNPVLLKPQTETGAQVVVQGRVVGNAKARDYQLMKPELMSSVLESFARLSAAADIVIVEGAGSAAEVNLRAGDIANMGFAAAADVSVVLIGDIDRGGVIAQLVGTWNLLSDRERKLTRGFIVNKFRGDPSLFQDGRAIIREHTGMTDYGVVPWFEGAARLPREDAFYLGDADTKSGVIKIAVPIFSRIANFDDLDPLRAEPDVTVTMVKEGEALPGDADLILLPGSKATLFDLSFLFQQGWDIDISAHVRRDGAVMGICGGYQMLGQIVSDPEGIEGPASRAQGLGLLDIETMLTAKKTLVEVTGTEKQSEAAISGYEMHIGQTRGPGIERAMLDLSGRPDGAVSADGLIAGCYVHGIFASDTFRSAFLQRIRPGARAAVNYEAGIEQALDALADHIEVHLDIAGMIDG